MSYSSSSKGQCHQNKTSNKFKRGHLKAKLEAANDKFKRGHIKAKLEAANYFVYFAPLMKWSPFFLKRKRKETRHASGEVAYIFNQ
jgi:hypothetical protein